MSIINDVNRSIRAIDKIGQSKKDARDYGDWNNIHGDQQKRKTLQISKEFANFCRDNYNVKKLHNVTEEHYRHFLATKHDTTLGHQRNIETALQHLQKGLEVRAERYGKEPTYFMTERLTPPYERGEGVADRSYSADEIKKIEQGVSTNTNKAIFLMKETGMRVSEACSVTPESINYEDKTIFVIGKGGRERYVPFEAKHEQTLKNLSDGLVKEQKIVGIEPKSVSANCKKVADQQGVENWSGTHGFRHTFAREQIDKHMTTAEKQLFDKCIENYAKGRQFDYAIQENRREIYNSMKEKMDAVHQKLGHGKNRFDLALRYMK